MAQGLSDKEAAAVLGLSEHTIHRHISNVLNKARRPRAPPPSPRQHSADFSKPTPLSLNRMAETGHALSCRAGRDMGSHYPGSRSTIEVRGTSPWSMASVVTQPVSDLAR